MTQIFIVLESESHSLSDFGRFILKIETEILAKIGNSNAFSAQKQVVSRKKKGLHQRWSRGHKARGQGQGHKKNPRPRTAFPRTDPLEAKDRNARGQGQGPSTQPQVFSKKKGLQKSFSGNLQFIGVARTFNWGGLNHKSHAMTPSKICLLALN